MAPSIYPATPAPCHEQADGLPKSAQRPVSAAASDKLVLPLGALMLAVSVSGWAQSTLPASPESAPDSKTLAPVTVTGVRTVRSKGEQAATAMERRMLVVIGGALLVALVSVLLFYLLDT